MCWASPRAAFGCLPGGASCWPVTHWALSGRATLPRASPTRASLRRTQVLSQEGVLSREEAVGPREAWGQAAGHTASAALGPGPARARHPEVRLLMRKQRSRQGQPRNALERSQLRACHGAARPDPPRAAWARGGVSCMGTVQRASDLRRRQESDAADEVLIRNAASGGQDP